MQLGPVSSPMHKSKIKTKVREISEPIIESAVVNFINSHDWLLVSAKTWSTSSWVVTLNFSSTADNCKALPSELQEVEFAEESITMLHVFA